MIKETVKMHGNTQAYFAAAFIATEVAFKAPTNMFH